MVTLLLRRLALAFAAVFEVYAEAQAMARAAHRRYPFLEE
jgi:hypothetical protein